MWVDTLLLIVIIGTVVIYLFSRFKILNSEQYMIVHRKNKTILEKFGGFVFLVPFIDSITILSISEQDTPIDSIIVHDDQYFGLKMNIKWQIIDPKDTFFGFYLQYKRKPMKLLEMELGRVLVSIFKYVTEGSDIGKITELNISNMKGEIDTILSKKGIKLDDIEIFSIDTVDPAEYETIKAKYKRVNLRRYDTDKDLVKDRAQHALGGQEALFRNRSFLG